MRETYQPQVKPNYWPVQYGDIARLRENTDSWG